MKSLWKPRQPLPNCSPCSAPAPSEISRGSSCIYRRDIGVFPLLQELRVWSSICTRHGYGFYRSVTLQTPPAALSRSWGGLEDGPSTMEAALSAPARPALGSPSHCCPLSSLLPSPEEFSLNPTGVKRLRQQRSITKACLPALFED